MNQCQSSMLGVVKVINVESDNMANKCVEYLLEDRDGCHTPT